MSSTISAIVVNYNAGEFLRKCIDSLLASPIEIEIIIVDNASADNSLALLSESPRIHIIRNSANLGFAAACNQGIQKSSAPILLFINPDCVFSSDALDQLLATLNHDPQIGMVGGLLLNSDGSEQEGGRRAIPTPWRSFVRAFGLTRFASSWPKLFYDFHLHKQPLPTHPTEVEAISGACMLVRRDAIDDVGEWDEGYFLHCEDLDWCIRFRQKAWKILFVSQAKITHESGACSKDKKMFVEWHKHKGMIRFYRKFFKSQYPSVLMGLVTAGVWLRFGMVATYQLAKRVKRLLKRALFRENLTKSADSGSSVVEQSMVELQQMQTLAERGEWTTLEEKSREFLSKNLDLAEPMALLAYSLQQQNQLEEAAQIAKRAAALAPDLWLANFIAGVALKGIGKTQEACEYLRQASFISPNDTQTKRQLIEAVAESEGIDSAATVYSEICHKLGEPNNVVVAPLRAVCEWADMTGLTLLDAGPVEEIPFKEPHVWGKPASTTTVTAMSNKPYVADIPNARIFSNSSLILTSDGTALNDTARDRKFGRAVSFAYEAIVLAQQTDKVLLSFSEYQSREIEAGIFLSGLASNAYGHWLPDFLPKLQFLQQHPDFSKLPLIVDAGMPQTHFDHLRRLVSNQLILLQANESFLCRRLLVAPSPAFFPVELFPNDIPVHEMPGLSPRAMRFLQSKNTPNKKRGDKRLFLARKNMKWRRLLNEAEIAEDLSQLGFETIFLENMTLDEQINLFEQAQWIVAPNGSALLNLIFADPSVKLLVLTQPNLHNWGTFQGPMDSLGYQSMCVRGDYALAKDQKHSDYCVSVESIRQALSFLGMSEAVELTSAS